MQRTFKLDRVTLDEYNRLCAQIGKPPESGQFRDDGTEKELYRMLSTLSYGSLSELLSDMANQDPNLVWVPNGNYSIGEAKKELAKNKNKYLAELLRTQEEAQKLVAWIPGFSKHLDRFDFSRKGSLWVLNWMFISSRNASLYELLTADSKPIRPLGSTAAIYISE